MAAQRESEQVQRAYERAQAAATRAAVAGCKAAEAGRKAAEKGVARLRVEARMAEVEELNVWDPTEIEAHKAGHPPPARPELSPDVLLDDFEAAAVVGVSVDVFRDQAV